MWMPAKPALTWRDRSAYNKTERICGGQRNAKYRAGIRKEQERDEGAGADVPANDPRNGREGSGAARIENEIGTCRIARAHKRIDKWREQHEDDGAEFQNVSGQLHR